MLYLEYTVRIVEQTRPDALSWKGGSVNGRLVLYGPASASRDAASTCAS